MTLPCVPSPQSNNHTSPPCRPSSDTASEDWLRVLDGCAEAVPSGVRVRVVMAYEVEDDEDDDDAAGDDDAFFDLGLDCFCVFVFDLVVDTSTRT